MRLRTIFIFLLIIESLFAGYNKSDKIEGKVQDLFGNPLKDVMVKIEKSTFTAKTDDSGLYSLDYAPSAMKLIFSKDSYTTMSLSLNIHQKTHYPAETVILYPIPKEEGMFYIDTDNKRLIKLEKNGKIEKNAFRLPYGQRKLQYYVKNLKPSTAYIKSGKAMFIDRTPYPVKCTSFKENGLFYNNEPKFKNNYNGFIKDTDSKVGAEKLTVRTVKLTPGDYAWVQMSESIFDRGEAEEGGVAFGFKVEGGSTIKKTASLSGDQKEQGEVGLDPKPVSQSQTERKDSDSESAKALYDKGLMYWSSNNHIEAKRYFKMSCDGGYVLGCEKLGIFYRLGFGGEKDHYKAVKYSKKGCDNGTVQACADLAFAYEKGRGGLKQDYSKAKELFKKACDRGFKPGCKMYDKRKVSNPKSVSGNNSVSSNSSLISKQKDQQSTQPPEPVSNKLTDSEREELEQLRAEKAKSAREKKANSEPANQSQTEKSKSFQNTRTDSYETYIARISQMDHFGKSGQRLKDAGTILQQDRANYHKYYKRDREDRGDSRFGTRDNRNKIKRMLERGSTSQKTLSAIRYGTPLVKVKIYQNHIDVTLESNGGQTRQKQPRKTSSQRTTVPVMIGGDPELDACGATGVIRGISRRGDGFLAVRSGPGTKYKMIDKFYRNGEQVTMCDWKGKWVGIVYGKDCGEAYDNIAKRKPYEGSCKSGWIFKKYIRLIAG